MATPITAHSDPRRNGQNHDHAAVVAPGVEELSAWDDDASADVDKLPRENALLREQAAELERLLGELRQEAEQALAEQQREFEGILEEKSEVIRDLHQKLQESSARPVPKAAVVPREEELMKLGEELEQERQQLKDDEEAMMEQMGQMEVQMSRERAELARQRSELQRLQGEIRHELELAARDAALRERLAPLQRRHQEMTKRNGSTQADAGESSQAKGTKDSGILKRFFG